MNRIDFLHRVKELLPNNPISIEIGVHKGYFAKDIYEILCPSKLYLVDPWENGSDKNSPHPIYHGELHGLATAYSDIDDLDNVKKLFANVSNDIVIIKQGFSYDIVEDFPDRYFDFIYIDATHIYESVKADLNMFFSKLKKNGLLCGHDYVSHSSFGVIQAVDEFIISNNAKLLLKSNDSDFAIQFNNS